LTYSPGIWYTFLGGGGVVKLDELEKPIFTIKETAGSLGVHVRTVMRMLEDGRLEGELVNTLRGKIWLINPVCLATLLIRKQDSGRTRFPRAKKKEGK
jgi:excisionase family DNA binding protein